MKKALSLILVLVMLLGMMPMTAFASEAEHTHTYEDGICTECSATVSPYLQQLPENIVGCTNLYNSLAPVKGYYTATKYDTSNGAVLSVVIPVEPGDRIAASSFGPISENMGSVNGIRVTYLLGDKIVTSLSAGEVYNRYTNNGYITVPDGVDAVCVPWWKPSDSNWLTLSQISKDHAIHSPKTVSPQAPTCTEKGYTVGEICEVCNASLGSRKEIPATGHDYNGNTCTICGTVNVLAILDGKYVSILGDSISTFNGYSNDATVNTTIGGNGPRYDAGIADTKPGSYCLLESVDQTWWMHFANRSGMKLLVNNSWAGSQVFGGKTSDGRVIPAAYLDRCVNLHDNTLENNPGNAPIYPDVIFVYLGINDYNFNRSKVGTGVVDYAGLVNSDGAYVTPTTFGEAYGIMLHKMRNAYPNAQIFAMTLLPENLYSVDKTAWEQHNAYIRAAAEYYDIPVVDLAENCAITWENYSGYMIDKIHPTTAGMKLISDCIETELVGYYKENQPHTHTYETYITAPTCTEQGYTTYSCACGESYATDYVDATGEHTYENGICTGCGVKEWDTDGDGVLEILAIGNSFSVDALQYAYQIARNLGIEEIAIGNLYIGGCTLATHAANAAGDLAKYTYYYNDNGTWKTTSSYKISTALESRSWDYVSLQQGSPVSGVESSYNQDLSNLISYVKGRSDAKLVWHMTWAYQQNSTHSAFPTYNKDQMNMYNAIVSAVQNKIVTNENFDLIIPNGTAVQNSRTSLLGDTTTRDGYHMSYDYGRYLTGLLFVKTVTGLSIDGVTYMPSGVDAEEKAIAIESVNHASAKPFAVTQSAYVRIEPEIPDEGYILLQPKLHKGAYWNATDKTRYNVLIADANNSKSFFATDRFTKKELPVGSIIVLKSGWQYRPDGWITDAVQSSRVDTTTESYVVVTEEWWSDYTIRGFNISKVGLPSMMNVSQEEVRAAFQILVPENSHTHNNENGICTLCGKIIGPVITQQPVDGEAKMGQRYMVEVKAEGEKLKYQWYFRNAGSSVWYKSSVRDNTYDDVMTKARAGREVYCVITDAKGNSVTTETAKLICIPTIELEVVTQPVNAEAVLGERYCVTVEAQGDDLKYQWYFRNAGSDKWYKSGVRDNTYDDIMTKARAGREIYCVITDAYGNSVTTDVATLIRTPIQLKIISQPTDAFCCFGEKFCATVEAEGEGLKYRWYFRNAGSDIWYTSGVRDNTYDDVMIQARNGREIYCVITDEYGNSVATDVVRLTAVPKMELKLLGQTYESAVMGERYCVTVEAQGDGLKYQWYFRNAGTKQWFKSGVTDNTYDDVMTKARAGREVYCVITDAFGNQITTEVISLLLIK